MFETFDIEILSILLIDNILYGLLNITNKYVKKKFYFLFINY